MIITTARSRAGLLLDAVLTIIGWIGFVYLFGTGILAIIYGAAQGPRAPLLPLFSPTLGTLSSYAVIAAANAAILIAWALYNHWRFKDQDRRKPLKAVGAGHLARSFALTLDQVDGLAVTKIATIHHDAQGYIVEISQINSESMLL
ncbi:poly-beta-1,6-N-acetyl-D-glucosamine biosynthesis protein PgaD [Pollutimonas sp. H1-120]|uniref:poly-beta-1,6-N-acetyl-D-glucosamine biosynthesis protein PgaD n=1 Tax=Pollutimonas sp. H1-120 TaxID=3148824 RepID=UPI003B515826